MNNRRPQPGANPHQTPMNSVSTTVCPCCQTARWFCPGCGTEGHWLAPTPEPAWPVQLNGSCPSCRAKLSLQITGFAALSPAVSALERALGLPPAAPRHRRGK
jgi:hypothetical protein